MPRCPECNKFCTVEADFSNADVEAEVEEADVSKGTVEVRVSGTIYLVSECCNEEVGRMTFDENVDVKGEKEYDA